MQCQTRESVGPVYGLAKDTTSQRIRCTKSSWLDLVQDRKTKKADRKSLHPERSFHPSDFPNEASANVRSFHSQHIHMFVFPTMIRRVALRRENFPKLLVGYFHDGKSDRRLKCRRFLRGFSRLASCKYLAGKNRAFSFPSFLASSRVTLFRSSRIRKFAERKRKKIRLADDDRDAFLRRFRRLFCSGSDFRDKS